ncbi:MAG TPA: GDSL-type esterase/lipase family protein [Thermoanaerobaculia bacterium]|nr:GDSL-type esterase/lipase family protein [Thermoanaerobaculia bacterium]
MFELIRSAILYHVYSGHLFFTALLMFVVGISVRRLRVLGLLALPLALFSGTPMPLIAAVPLLVAAIVVLVLPFKGRLVAGVLAVVIAAGIEIPWHLGTAGEVARAPLVLGDSLASGGFGETRTWPELLGSRNLSSPSETVASALERELPVFQANDVVIVELGGNDMLDRTPVVDFERSLDALLGRLKPARVVMLELPILPGRWGYGAIQRRLARKHGVVLIPKRVLARALTGVGNTTDGLHLTDRGHEQLARGLARTLGRY